MEGAAKRRCRNIGDRGGISFGLDFFDQRSYTRRMRREMMRAIFALNPAMKLIWAANVGKRRGGISVSHSMV